MSHQNEFVFFHWSLLPLLHRRSAVYDNTMELVICENVGVEAEKSANISSAVADFASLASQWCRTQIQELGARSFFLPAGQTPESLYELWERTRPDFLAAIDLLQIDDVLTGPKAGMFRRFFTEKLPSYQLRFHAIERADQVADAAVLGLGLNGHIAFHEPGLDSRFFSGCVRLNEVTCANLKVDPGTWGISYGAAAFLEARAVLVMVKGRSKREILKRLLNGDRSLPAAGLLDHPRLTILADREAIG
jgi:6-phosphogluconolactonase/glucosamine-6-phosphate isomerase/deaminase